MDKRRKSVFISGLAEGQTVSEFYCIKAVSVRQSKKGADYLAATLSDRTGSIEARMWSAPPNPPPQSGSFVLSKGSVELYNGQPQLNITSMQPVSAEELDIADFLPSGDKDTEALYEQVMAAVEKLAQPYCNLLKTIMQDFKAKLIRAPAGKSYHHAYIGGLIEHIHSLCCASIWLCEHKPYKLDRNLMVAACVTHDLGKLWELAYETSIDYSTAGQFLGHIFLGAMVVKQYCMKLGVDKTTEAKILHVILAHHGEKQFGSPVEPVLREAFAFHSLDKLDATLAAIDAAPDSGGEWTQRIPMIGRSVYAR